MQTFHGLDELEKAVGTHLGHSEWHTVTQERIDQFAEATGDNQWIHVDPERAKDGPFGGTIAHGYLTLSMIPRMVWQIYTVEGLKMAVNYGSNKVRFPSPVPVDSRLRAGAELVGLERGPKGAQVTVRVTVEREGGDKPACVAEVVSVLAD
jgi:acyl dehydratase